LTSRTKGIYYVLYVVLDIFSRYVVGRQVDGDAALTSSP